MKFLIFLFSMALFAFNVAAVPLSAINSTMATTFQLNSPGREPLYQTTLPGPVYQYTRSHNLQDISITNGNGERVPYALLDYLALHPETTQTQAQTALPVYNIEEATLNDSNILNIQLEKLANKTAINITSSEYNPSAKNLYLIDAGEKHSPLHTFILDWQGGEAELLTLKVYTSDNLKDWSYVDQFVLLKTKQNGQQILNNTVKLPYPTTARYLQFNPEPKGAANFRITQVEARYTEVLDQVPPYQWQPLQFLEGHQNNAGITNLTYEIDGRYPVSQLKIALPEENTITNVRVSTRDTDKENWRYLTSAALYSVQQNGNKETNPDISIPKTVARYWQLKFNQSNGGIGKENPKVSAGWLPHTIVWNARGNPPFQLEVGNNPKLVNSVAITELIPDYDLQKVMKLPQAVLVFKAGSDISSKNQLNTWASDSKPDYKRLLLWAGLILGVILLAMMAYSLLRNEHKQKN